MHSQRTIKNILNSEALESGQVIVLNTIPLSKRRFEKELNPGLLRLLSRKPKDFVRSQSWRWPGWEAYETSIALPILKELLAIENTSNAVIDFDVTEKQFKRALTCGRFKAAFLFAHHFGGNIEFSDGGARFSDIKDFIASLPPERQLSIIFLVCQSEELMELKYDNIEGVGAIGCAAWKVPVRESYLFVGKWISFLKDGATLSDAYSRAIEHFSSYLRDNHTADAQK